MLKRVVHGPDPSLAGQRKPRLTTVAEIVGIVAGIVAVLAVGIPLVIDGEKNRSPADALDASTAAPTSPTTSANTKNPSDKPFDFELFDDFADSVINPAKWSRGDSFDSVPPLIYAQDGQLHMQIIGENGNGENSAIIRANLPRPARAISFEMTLLSSEGTNDGGGYAIVSSQGNRNHKLVMGPGGDGLPAAGYDICNKEHGCDDGVYEDFEHPGASQIQLQRPYHALIHRSDAGWSFQLDGFPEVTTSLENDPISSFKLYLYSFGEGVFHVAVDNIKVDYVA